MADRTARTRPAREPETSPVGGDAAAEELPAPLLSLLHERFGNAVVQDAIAGGGGALGQLIAIATAEDAAGRGDASMFSNRSMQEALRSEQGQAPQGQAEPSRSAAPAPQAPSPGPAPSAEPAIGPTAAVPGPAAAPEVADAASSERNAPSSQPDGLVDYYMEVHWDPAVFHGIAQQVGYPDGPTAVSAIDQLLPPDTSPGARAAINVASAVATGILDDFVIRRASEMLGLSGDLVTGLVDLGGDVAGFAEVGDDTGVAMVLGSAVLEGALSAIQSFVDLGLEQVGWLQTAIDVLTLLEFGLGQAVALGGAVLGPAGVAFVESVLAEIAAVLQGLNAVIEVVRVPLQAAALAIDVAEAAITTLQYVYADVQAGRAEADGNFERAAAYRDLARGQVMELMGDWLATLVSAVFTIPLLGQKVKTGTRTLTGVANAGRRVIGRVVGGGGGEGGMGAGDVLQLILDEVATRSDWWHGADRMGFHLPGADPMRGGDPFVDRRGLVGGTDVLQSAREQTFTWLDETAAGLAAEGPDWYQKLVAEILDPPNPTFEDATSPTYWVLELLDQAPYIWELVEDGSLEGLAAGCDAAAAVLPLAQPFADQLTAVILETKPQLDAMVAELDGFVQRQSLSLDKLEATAAAVEEALVAARALGAAGLAAPMDEILAQLQGIDLEVDVSGLPGPLRDQVLASIEPLRAALDGAIARLQQLREEAMAAYDVSVGEILAELEAEAELYRASLAEGGSFQVALEAEVAAFQGQVAAAAEAFATWDGRIDIDCGAAAEWLRAVADACRRLAAQEDATEDPWPEILRQTAIPAIDAWRARHGAEVEAQYHPAVPPWELAAVDQVVADLRGRIDPASLVGVETAYQACVGFRGAEGREAVYGFWQAEAELVQAIQRVDDRGGV